MRTKRVSAESRVEEVRTALAAQNLPALAIYVTGMLDEIHSEWQPLPAPPGAPYKCRILRKHALRRAVRKADAGPRPHRLADQRRLLLAQMVEQRGQIVDEGVAPASIQIARQAETAVVEGDDAVRARQGIDLPIPDRVVAADAVREHDRRSLPLRLPV